MSLLVGSIQRVTLDNVSLSSQLAIAQEKLTKSEEMHAVTENKLVEADKKNEKQKMIIYELNNKAISCKKELCVYIERIYSQ